MKKRETVTLHERVGEDFEDQMLIFYLAQMILRVHFMISYNYEGKKYPIFGTLFHPEMAS